MEGNGNHLYTMAKILAFIIFSRNDRWHILYHFSSYFVEKREHYQILEIWLFLRKFQECWLKKYRFLWKVLWVLVTLVSEENDLKAATKQDLSHSHTAIQSEPCPRHEAELETYQLHNCEQSRGTSLQRIIKQPR